MKLVIGGIKGGTGKTTLATNLAYMRSATGKKVLLVDADEQKSASAWSDQRVGMKIETKWTTIQLSGMYLFSEVEKLSKNYDDVIVDTGGRDNSSQRSALTIADVFLMPFRPKAFDIWTLGSIRKLLCEVVATNPRLKPIAILNQSDANSQTDIEEAKEIISECKELVCLPMFIGSRKSFGNAATEGLSVMELNSDKKSWIQKAQAEMQQLYQMIYS
jgi:chromosome partitioning protein